LTSLPSLSRPPQPPPPLSLINSPLQIHFPNLLYLCYYNTIFNPSKISKKIYFNEKKIFLLKNISKIYILRISKKIFQKKQREITISGG
jgi:hypothetical protein